jgi:hypothetical protein
LENNMEHQEYPKALYLAGQQLVVEDDAQEDAARADGYDDWHADNARGEVTSEPEAEVAAPAIDADALAETESRLREWELQLTAREDAVSAREAELAEAVARHEEAQRQAEQAAAEQSGNPADQSGATEQQLDRDVLKARAAELKLDYPANIKTDKLAALVAEAEGK